ncbi:MAG: UDP-2,3-diacylglucosamine diphosphatase LpxI [Candidatus Electrothrix sp. Rat3]|nr:UDP-2,3-diacylglucosamine diphosphatase LpxI [Candidatus Electrothrix rattekaaiensis]
MSTPIGIIAGGGQFPLLFTEAAQERKRRVVAVCHQNETQAELEHRADVSCWVKLGQLGKIIRFFHEQGVREAVFCGTITKTRMFRDIFPDFKGLTLWNKIDKRLDDAILRAVSGALEKEGIKVLASTCYLDHLFFPKGILGKRKPSREQLADIRFGWRIAREIGRLDIGQCVVVREGAVLAVEAIEGTDAAIRRGGQLSGSGAVVVKMKKPGQDFRFDLPATGTKTIETLASVKGSVLAVEAGQSLLFDRDTMIAAADQAGIVVVGVQEDEAGELIF